MGANTDTGATLALAERWPTLESTQALERFLAGVERRALRIAQYATGNREDALDIVQEAMLKLAERYAAKPAAEWPPLFYSILVSRIRDFQRRTKVRNRFRVWLRGRDDGDGDEPDPVSTRPDPSAAPPERIIDGERGVAPLERGIAGLPARQREAFVLRVWEGLDVAHTARAMGCSEGSVKTHLSRAMHALREQLEEHLQ